MPDNDDGPAGHEDDARYVGTKFRNMLGYIDAAHPDLLPNTKLLRLVPDSVVHETMRARLLPHRALIRQGPSGLAQIAARCDGTWVARLLARAEQDPKLLRYCELFARLCDDDADPKQKRQERRESWWAWAWSPVRRIAQNFLLPWWSSPADPDTMNQRDPTDLSNVSVEGVGDRLYLSRAAEESKPPRKPPAAPKAPAAPQPPAAPKKTAAEIQQAREEAEYKTRQTLLDKVGRYRERFPKLKKRNGTLSIKSSLSELSDEVHYIEQQLGKEEGPTGALKPANLLFIAGMHGIEMGTQVYNPLGLKLQGLGSTTQQSIKQFEPLLDEFMIKQNMEMTASVEFRIIMMVVTTMATVHMANTGQGTELLAKLQATGQGPPSSRKAEPGDADL